MANVNVFVTYQRHHHDASLTRWKSTHNQTSKPKKFPPTHAKLSR